jgi:5-formyltetrahydrofolate cyclo-ligase
MSLPPEDFIRRRVKAELRKRMRALRNTTPTAAGAERSAQICARLGELPQLKDARSVALFWPIEARHEVDLRSFDSALRARVVRVAYPAIDPESQSMTFRYVEDPTSMEERGLGFREPPPDAPIALALDVIVVPALAVDPSGHRLGYGRGFYDAALATRADSFKVAVAYDYQLVAELPAEPHDVQVDWIVTDARSVACA